MSFPRYYLADFALKISFVKISLALTAQKWHFFSIKSANLISSSRLFQVFSLSEIFILCIKITADIYHKENFNFSLHALPSKLSSCAVCRKISECLKDFLLFALFCVPLSNKLRRCCLTQKHSWAEDLHFLISPFSTFTFCWDFYHS